MHATVLKVATDPASAEVARQQLHERVIPMIKSSPGFVRGFWTASEDRTDGLSMVIWDTRESAEKSLEALRSMQFPEGVTPQGAELREVVGDA